MSRTKKLIVGSLLATAVLVLARELAQAKKPAPPPLPPVRYEIRLFHVYPSSNIAVPMHPNQMNNSGQVVGYCGSRAFLYDPVLDDHDDAIGQAIDLNEIVDPETIPDGWNIRSATGINNRGDIVGSLSGVGGRRGYVIDMSAEDEYGIPQPQLHTIPDGDLGTGTYARRINNNGDVLGSYVIDDATWGWYLFNPGLHGDTPYELKVLPLATITNTCVLSDCVIDGNGVPVGPAIAGRDQLGVGGFRFWPQLGELGVMERFDINFHSIRDMNSEGAFCGEGWFLRNKKRTYRRPYVIRCDGSLDVITESTNFAWGINSSEDLIMYNDETLHHADLGLLNLNDLVTGTTDDLETWYGSQEVMSDINDRANADPIPNPDLITREHFGQIAGWLYETDRNGDLVRHLGFLLTPVAPTP